MINVILSLFSIFPAAAVANCPDYAGSYDAATDATGYTLRVTLKQEGCELLTLISELRHPRADGEDIVLTEKLTLDGESRPDPGFPNAVIRAGWEGEVLKLRTRSEPMPDADQPVFINYARSFARDTQNPAVMVLTWAYYDRDDTLMGETTEPYTLVSQRR